MHGTTIATNAVLEGKGARVGLVTTEGYRQILQIARSYVPGGLAGWIVWPKPQPLAALQDTIEVRERVSANGEIVQALDETSARAALSYLKGRHVEAITGQCPRSCWN
jgi:N-methylhydantoinase A